MSINPTGFDPFWMFRLPLSGDVNQRITAPWFSPSLTVNYAGDPAIEDRVVTVELTRFRGHPNVSHGGVRDGVQEYPVHTGV
jgi:hypothetical protein